MRIGRLINHKLIHRIIHNIRYDVIPERIFRKTKRQHIVTNVIYLYSLSWQRR